MGILRFEYDSLRKQARAGFDRSKWHDRAWDGEDVAQEGVLRLLQAGGQNSVNGRKGTMRQLMGGFVRVTGLEIKRKGRRRRTCLLPDEIVDAHTTNPLEELVMDDDRLLSQKRLRFLRVWWKHLGERRKRALLRIHGPMFERSDSTKPTAADHTAAFHARQRLKVLLALVELAEQASP